MDSGRVYIIIIPAFIKNKFYFLEPNLSVCDLEIILFGYIWKKK